MKGATSKGLKSAKIVLNFLRNLLLKQVPCFTLTDICNVQILYYIKAWMEVWQRCYDCCLNSSHWDRYNGQCGFPLKNTNSVCKGTIQWHFHLLLDRLTVKVLTGNVSRVNTPLHYNDSAEAFLTCVYTHLEQFSVYCTDPPTIQLMTNTNSPPGLQSPLLFQ